MARSRKQVVQAQAEVAQLLTGMGLQLHPDKTCITNFQHGFRFLGQVFVGDLIIPVKQLTSPELTTAKAENSLRLVHTDSSTGVTAMQQAMVAALKVAHQPIPPPLFVVLGYAVRPETPVQIESDEVVWKTGMSTIYLIQQGTTLRRDRGRFLLQLPKEPEVEIPIREVERILVFGNIQLTTTVISTCLELQIPVVFLTQTGEYKGHLWSGEFCDLQAETEQFRRQHDATFQLQVARGIIQGKLANSKQLLLRLNRKQRFPEVAEAIAGISCDLEAASNPESATTIDKLRGYEGAAAARYFPALGRLICNSGFTLKERVRRPPTDPMNSLLSFGYTLLFNNVLSLILAEGLNPYLGNLHSSDKKQAHLAFDLMEEFRSPIVDTLVMKLVNQKILKPTDFSWPNQDDGVYLTETARRVFLKHFEERISLKIHHPDLKEQVSYRRVIQLQIQRYKRTLLEEIPYQSFLRVD